MEPVLLRVYINDLPLHTSSNSAVCHMFVDDTTLHTTGKSILKITETRQLCPNRAMLIIRLSILQKRSQ